MKTSVLISFICFFAVLFTGCSHPEAQITDIKCSVDEGWLISDDVYFSNISGRELGNVHITLTLTGDNGGQRQFTRYLGAWQSGQQTHFSIAVNDSVVNIQRVDLNGRCDEGVISKSWYKP